MADIYRLLLLLRENGHMIFPGSPQKINLIVIVYSTAEE